MVRIIDQWTETVQLYAGDFSPRFSFLSVDEFLTNENGNLFGLK